MKTKTTMLLSSFFLSLLLDQTLGQACTGDIEGDQTPGAGRAHDSTNPNHRSFLVIGGVTDITCQGAITQWTIYSSGQPGPTPVCHDITFQVWRPVDPSRYIYQLIGENKITDLLPVAACLPSTLDIIVPPVQQIPVQPNDVIGWTDSNFFDPGSTARRMMIYDEALPGSNQYDKVHILSAGHSCAMTPGSTCSWDATQAEFTVRGYSLNVHLDVPTAAGPPVFENLPATVTIKEHEPAGIHVYTAVARDDLPWTPIVTQTLEYSIVVDPPTIPAPGPGFTVNKDTGMIATTMELDFEDLYSNGGNPYEITVTAEGLGGPTQAATATLTVIIEDINEPHDINNLPDTITVDCSATGQAVQVFGPLACDDPDYIGGNPQFHDHSYYLMDSQPNSDLFELDARVGPPQGLYVVTKIDLTTWDGQEDVYVLKIGAGDGEFFSGPKDLHIHVHNVRKPPVLSNLPNSVSVPENDPGGSEIFGPLLASTDPNGNPVTFHKLAEYPRTWDPAFRLGLAAVDDSIYTIPNNPRLDFFAAPQHQVEITVEDNRGLWAQSSANLTVDIIWMNKPPFFIETTYVSELPEREPVGTVVPGIELQADDRDIPLGDWLDYTISGTGSHLFHADNVTNRVYVIGDAMVDINQPSKLYDLDLYVYDWQGERDRADLEITITDINDHAPVFDPTEYSGVVAENADAETVILSLTCTDDDSGENARLTYTIPDPVADLYYQVTTNGDLTVKQPVNYHEYPNMTFEVVATDDGVPQLSGSATVSLTITPVNNHEPKFVPDFYNVDLKSDARAGDLVVALSVVDPDADEVNSVTFFLFVPDPYFYIGQTSGEIKVERAVNTYRKYILNPMVTDKGSPEYYSDPATVRIDTYSAPKHLVNLHLMMPMVDFEDKKDDFIVELNKLLTPWVVFRDNYLLEEDRTVVTVYAWRDSSAATRDDLDKPKHFVHRDDMLPKLRTNIQGNPKDVLRGPEFAEYQIIKVLPTHPVWIVDTVEGIVTLTLICLLVVCLTVGLLIYLCKRKGWFCFKKTRVTPTPPPPTALKPTSGDEFDLKYAGMPKTAATSVLIPATRGTSRAYMWETDKDKEPLPPVAESR